MSIYDFIDFTTLKNIFKNFDISINERIIKSANIGQHVHIVLHKMYEYVEKRYELLGQLAFSVHHVYEYSKNGTTKYSDYFNKYYKDWICLVLETEGNKIHSYTKNDIVLAFRGYYAHSGSKLRPKPQYLYDFLHNTNKPKILFYEVGVLAHSTNEFDSIHCLEQKEFTITFSKTFHFDIKEAMFANIISEINTIGVENNHIGLEKSLVGDFSLLKNKDPKLCCKLEKQAQTIKKLKQEQSHKSNKL